MKDNLLIVDTVIPCYEVGGEVRYVLEALLNQTVPSDVELRVILVDDGSSEAGAVPAGLEGESISVLKHVSNRGRAAACNTGARAGSGDLIWFLDADCVPESQTTLQAQLEVIASHDVCVGPVFAKHDGFWSRYQSRVAESRLSRLRHGMDVNACTSANLVVRRSVFEALGGFDERYTKYGFEDRDLFLRLAARKARLGFAEQSAVFHEAHLDLPTVCRKLFTAGRFSSGVLRADHPVAYRNSLYGKLDVRNHGPLFGVAVWTSWCVLRSGIRFASPTLEVNVIPFVLRMTVARFYSAIAYARGTLQAKRDVQVAKTAPRSKH